MLPDAARAGWEQILQSISGICPIIKCFRGPSWLAYSAFRIDTLDRMEARGEAPSRVRISPRRWGYPVGGIKQWQAAKMAQARRGVSVQAGVMSAAALLVYSSCVLIPRRHVHDECEERLGRTRCFEVATRRPSSGCQD